MTRIKTACSQPLLGKPCLQLARGLLGSLRPAKIYLATNVRKESIIGHEAFSDKDVLFAEGWPQDMDFLFPLKDELSRGNKKDIIIMDARFPLIQPKTLKSIYRRHLDREKALTVLRADRKVQGKRSCPPRKKIGFSSTAAIFINGEEIIEIIKDEFKGKRSRLLLHGLLRHIEKKGKKIEILTLSPDEGLIVDSPHRAALAIRVLKLRKIRQLEARGVMVLDPLSTWIDLDVRIGQDTVLYPDVVIEGNSRLGRECLIYPFVHLIDMRVGDRVKIFSSTMLEGSRVKDEAQVGPFTHFRPRTVLQPGAKVGNFVEMKNTVFGPRSKAGHLSYLGDCVVGEGANIGAGTITCNYDGVKKHRTIIESGAFIGSGTELVAPVRVGRNSYIGAGSTITKDVSPEALAVARSRQVEKAGWVRRKMMRR